MASSFHDKHHRWIVHRSARRPLVHTPGGRWLRRYIVEEAAMAAMMSNVANDAEITPQVRCDAMSAHLARNWRLVLLRGVLALMTGVLAVLASPVTLAALILLFGGYMLADGATAIASAVRSPCRHARWRWFVAEGIIKIAAGVWALLVLLPAAVLPLATLFAASGMIAGATMAAASCRLRKDYGRGWLCLSGLTSIAWGALLFLLPPPDAALLTLWFGAYAVPFGAMLAVLAFRLRARCAAPRRAS